jgi:class 3 adenylate cyclase
VISSLLMRDWAAFRSYLERTLRGEKVPEEAWMPYRDRLSILITDLSGFTRLTRELGNSGMVALLHGMRGIALPILEAHGGVPVKYQADDLFAAFRSAEGALRTAVDLQRALADPRPPLPARVELCMGIGFGEVLWWGDEDLYGEEVNLASKLGEDTAEPGEILLTESAARVCRERLPGVLLRDAGEIPVGGHSYPYLRYEGGL